MPASLELTPASKKVLKEFGKKNSEASEQVISQYLNGMASWIVREETKAFVDMKQPGGDSWLPNRGRYMLWKAEMGQNKPGTLSGALAGSMVQNVNKAANEASGGSTMSYAPFFNYGTSSGARGMYVHGPGGSRGFFNFSGGIPARPFIPEIQYATKHGVNLFNQLVEAKFK